MRGGQAPLCIVELQQALHRLLRDGFERSDGLLGRPTRGVLHTGCRSRHHLKVLAGEATGLCCLRQRCHSTASRHALQVIDAVGQFQESSGTDGGTLPAQDLSLLEIEQLVFRLLCGDGQGRQCCRSERQRVDQPQHIAAHGARGWPDASELVLQLAALLDRNHPRRLAADQAGGDVSHLHGDHAQVVLQLPRGHTHAALRAGGVEHRGAGGVNVGLVLLPHLGLKQPQIPRPRESVLLLGQLVQRRHGRVDLPEQLLQVQLMRFRGGGCLSRGYRSPLLAPLHLLHASVDLGLLIGPVGGRPAGVHLLLIQALGGSTSTVSSCSILVQGLGAFDQAAAVDLVAKFGDVHQALPLFCIARSRAAFWSSRTARRYWSSIAISIWTSSGSSSICSREAHWPMSANVNASGPLCRRADSSQNQPQTWAAASGISISGASVMPKRAFRWRRVSPFSSAMS
ncbi:hypothetical protein G6F68_009496 [Rhizopus microsporus]|nr:hypothetical protein G6F68_009496 [Rhizopus microsporus]